MGADVIKTKTRKELEEALVQAKKNKNTTVVYIETDREQRVGGYAWWEVPVAEVSTHASVKAAYENLKRNKAKQRIY